MPLPGKGLRRWCFDKPKNLARFENATKSCSFFSLLRETLETLEQSADPLVKTQNEIDECALDIEKLQSYIAKLEDHAKKRQQSLTAAEQEVDETSECEINMKECLSDSEGRQVQTHGITNIFMSAPIPTLRNLVICVCVQRSLAPGFVS